MNQFDSALRLFEELDGLDDTFIEEGMLPDIALIPPILGGKDRHRSKNFILRFLNSGLGVAMLCAVVSAAVLLAVVRLGWNESAGDLAPPPGDNLPNHGTVEETLPSETDGPVTLPAEGSRVPAGTASVDENGLRYISNGDGTCTCMGLTAHEGQTTLHIPDYSPDGDVVTSIYSYAFRDRIDLTEVTLPAGLRNYDRNTFPMEAEIYRLCGNILYLGSDDNPYMVAVSTADNRPGATSLHPHTRLLASRALTYESGSYFALKWGDRVPAYTDSEVFTLPSTLAYVGEYALLDVGRDIAYNGYLVGWDALTAQAHAGLVRTPKGTPVTVSCLDGVTETTAYEAHEVKLDSTAYMENGILYGGYFTYYRSINEDYYDWIRNPEAFSAVPDQFITVSAVFGEESRVLTADELDSVRFTPLGTTNASLAAFAETYNRDLSSLYTDKSVVMLFLQEPALYHHTVADIMVTDGGIHVSLIRDEATGNVTPGERFVLIPLDDPHGALAGAAVSVSFIEPSLSP